MPSHWTETHPFISFVQLADKATPRLWTLLGEAASKLSHIAGAPLLPETAKQMLLASLIKGAHSTTAIEGNTLSEEQVGAIQKGTAEIPDSRAYQADEVKNVLSAMNELMQGGAKKNITSDLLQTFNFQILNGLKLEEGVVPGRYRMGGVSAGKYLAPNHVYVQELMGEFINWVNLPYNLKEAGIDEPIEHMLRAVLAHILFVWIHPFGDGNGRTARLIEQNMLLAYGAPVVCGHLLSNHYNLTRQRYYEALDESRFKRDPFIFAEYAIEGLVDGLQQQIEYVQSQQFETLWARLVREQIGGSTVAKLRQQALALELGNLLEGASKSEVSRLTIELAAQYAGKTTKTISRDLNALVDYRLVVQHPDGRFHANRQMVFVLISPRL